MLMHEKPCLIAILKDVHISGQTDNDHVITALCGSRNPYHVISQGQYIYFTFRTTHQNFGQPRGVELHFQVFGKFVIAPDVSG